MPSGARGSTKNAFAIDPWDARDDRRMSRKQHDVISLRFGERLKSLPVGRQMPGKLKRFFFAVFVRKDGGECAATGFWDV